MCECDDVNEPDETTAISLTKITPFLTLTSVDGEVLVIDDDGEEETAIKTLTSKLKSLYLKMRNNYNDHGENNNRYCV